ncbi:MAG TPA: hypothetical protein VKA18_02515 [Alphaproteobacteria bacterium]|nr:hypothetical protein [Alphaproteobacteria bacterium]
MEWPQILKQAAAPLLALGIVTASLVTTAHTKSDAPQAVNESVDASPPPDASGLWAAAANAVKSPVTLDAIVEVAMEEPRWIETQTRFTRLDRRPGKLLVIREFGLTDESDAPDIAANPAAYLSAIRIGFLPYRDAASGWIWAHYMPDGTVTDDVETVLTGLEESGRPIHLNKMGRLICEALPRGATSQG